MQTLKRWCYCGLTMVILLLAGAGTSMGQLKSGQEAPLFALKDTKGQIYELSTMKDLPMSIIYFFDADSRSSLEGMLHLDHLAKKYKDADLVVWGISRSGKSILNKFISQSKLSFPVLMDSGKVSDQYAARLILPTVCIIGPDLKLLDYFQGGGKTTEKMLVTLAERKLQNRRAEVAKAISEEVVKQNPQNVHAKSVKGYVELKEGDLKAAEKTFYDLSRSKGSGEILGKEGLSQVYARKGQTEKALKMTKEVETKTGERVYTHVVKGDMLYSQNKPEEAVAEYKKAIKNKKGVPSHQAVAYNRLGRFYGQNGDYRQSRDMFDKAETLDPYFVEATSNKGMIFERQGKWIKALEAYRRAQAIDRNDPFAATLAANARKMLLLQQDQERRRQLERQVEQYVQRYKKGPEVKTAQPEDPWTSGPMVVLLTEPRETGGLAVRDGFSRVLTLQVADQLNSSGRLQVVEPIVLKKVMDKLGLKQKDLSDQDMVLRLANAFGATLFGKGTLFHLYEGTLLKLTLMDTASSKATRTIERQFASSVTLKKDLHWLNRELLTAIMTEYPMQAFVVEVRGNQVLMNLGANQGVVNGSLFDVVEVKPEVVYKGKRFQPEPSVMATIEVVKVDSEFAYAHIKDQRRPIHPEDKLRERVQQLTEEDGQRIW